MRECGKGTEPREEHGDQLSDVDGSGSGSGRGRAGEVTDDGEKTPTGGEEEEEV